MSLRFKVAPVWTGDYDSTHNYNISDEVRDPNGTGNYRSLVNNNVGNPLSDTTKWLHILDLTELKETVDDSVAVNNTIKDNEDARVINENARISAEAGRVNAENSRVSRETARISAEAARLDAETNRCSAEATRVNDETVRIAAENSRANAESTRTSNETNRVNAENTRVTAENNRVNAESGRASAESTRVSNENTRVNAENTRISNENTRQSNEGTDADTPSADGSRWARYKQAEVDRNIAYSNEEGESTDAASSSGSRWARYKNQEAARQTDYETNEGESTDTADANGSRWARYKYAEAARDNEIQALRNDIQRIDDIRKFNVIEKSTVEDIAVAINNYYKYSVVVENITITLPTITSAKTESLKLFITTGDTININFIASAINNVVPEINFTDNYNLKSWNGYEITASYNGECWIIDCVSVLSYYGIRWSEDTGVIERIGNVAMHKALPIQTKMRKCSINDSGVVNKYISSNDPFVYEDGTSVDYSGGDGQIVTEIPEYHFEAFVKTINTVNWNYLKLYPNKEIGKVSPKYYYGSFEMIVDSATNSEAKGYSISVIDFLNSSIDKDTRSVNASALKYLDSATTYRNYGYSNVDPTDVKTSLGRPRTSINRGIFRSIAAKRGEKFSQQYWKAYWAVVRLYISEFCNFNVQADFNSQLTTEGYKQGGLSAGVTNANGSDWSAFNSYNPFIPCGVTIPLGNESGYVEYVFAANEFTTNAITFKVPSYRGIENIFGHIYKFIDGFNRKGSVINDVTTEEIYICDDITKFAESNPDGYVLESNTAPRASGNFGGVVWGEDGTFWPKPNGRSMYGDYFYNAYADNTWYTLRAGGSARSGSDAGLFCLHANGGSASADALISSRLLCTPE